MKILAVAGSPRIEKRSSTLKLVQAIAENTGYEYELISLSGKKIRGCIGCGGCSDDNTCKLKDDFTPLREKILEADAYILGACNFFSTINATMHAFLERWYQFRHQEMNELWGKPAVTASVAGVNSAPIAQSLELFCMYNFIKVVDSVEGLGAPNCYYCDYGETCKLGTVVAAHGEGYKITDENTPCVTKDQVCMEKARQAGKNLGQILKNGHDRDKATQEVQAAMMAMSGGNVNEGH